VLTPLGRSALKRAAPVHLRGVHRHFTQHLSDSDVAALRRILSKVQAGMDDEAE
jgi:DNA-binding MarR family transcriptional regulator